MNITKRIEKLEKRIPATAREEWHTVIVRSGQDADQRIDKYCIKNEVRPNAKFWIIEAVEPDPRRFKHDKE